MAKSASAGNEIINTSATRVCRLFVLGRAVTIGPVRSTVNDDNWVGCFRYRDFEPGVESLFLFGRDIEYNTVLTRVLAYDGPIA